jgi:hypothetical protein
VIILSIIIIIIFCNIISKRNLKVKCISVDTKKIKFDVDSLKSDVRSIKATLEQHILLLRALEQAAEVNKAE